MSDTSPTATANPRRRLKFQTGTDVVTEVNRLRRTPLNARAKWDLPQACRHLAATIEGNLAPPASTVATPEESARREGFFKVVFAPDGMPAGMTAGPDTQPPEHCTEADIDRLVDAFDQLDKYPHTHIKVGSCGPVPKEDVVKLHLVHAAHHLSFQEPVTPPRIGLKFGGIDALIADVNNLRNGYAQAGNWNLPQMSFHLSQALKAMDVPVTRTEPIEAEMPRRAFLAYILCGGQIPQGRPMPPGTEPVPHTGDAEVDELLAGLQRLGGASQSYVHFGSFGPVKIDEYRGFILAHSAHHLAYLSPLTSD